MKMRYRGQELGLKTGESLDFQIDKHGYVSIAVAGKHIGYLVLNDKRQPIFSPTSKMCFYLEPKNVNYSEDGQEQGGVGDRLQTQTKPKSELELDDEYLLPLPAPWYRRPSFWYRAIPVIILILFLVLCIVVWKIGYKHGQEWLIDTVNQQYSSSQLSSSSSSSSTLQYDR